MDENLVKRFQEAFADAAFAKEVLALKTPEEAQAKLREKGYEFTLDELTQFAKATEAAVKAAGELSDDDLKAVAGGYEDPGANLATAVVTGTMGAIATAAAVAIACW